MTKLTCHVTNCASNKNDCCCRPDIMVDGENAQHVSDTCCNSFVEKGKGEVSNNVCYCKEDTSLDVKCDAVTCVHNDSMKCAASSICIEGCHACEKNETECSTFKAE